MKLTKCASGHFYDADKYPECPYCNTGQAKTYTLLPGSSQELCYLGDTALLEPQELAGEETLRLGTATLKFVPFCGPDFSW